MPQLKKQIYFLKISSNQKGRGYSLLCITFLQNTFDINSFADIQQKHKICLLTGGELYLVYLLVLCICCLNVQICSLIISNCMFCTIQIVKAIKQLVDLW